MVALSSPDREREREERARLQGAKREKHGLIRTQCLDVIAPCRAPVQMIKVTGVGGGVYSRRQQNYDDTESPSNTAAL